MEFKSEIYENLSIFKDQVANGEMYQALEDLGEYIALRRYLKGFTDQLRELRENYGRILQFYSKGSKDPSRMDYFRNYREKIYRLIQDVLMAELLQTENKLSPIAQLSATIDADGIDEKLAEMNAGCMKYASATEMQDSENLQECQRFQESCSDYREALFSYLLISPQWDETTENLFVESVNKADEVTAQLMVSSIMLSTLMVFDFHKLSSLFRIYHEATSCKVRERAFVGALFSLDEKEEFWLEGQKELIRKYCSEKKDIQNVLDFQKQIVYLSDTEKDSKKVREKLDFSDIVNQNARLKEQLNNPEDIDSISLDEIISPEEGEEIADRVEETMRKYDEMEKGGSDLYYKGFSLLKSTPFFHQIANWFMPFYAQNPELIPLNNFLGGSDSFARGLEYGSPFCDSDTYSFAMELLMLSQKVPGVKNVADSFKPTKEQYADQQENPSLVRKKYLQDVFRFFKLSPMKGIFFPLFDAENKKRLSFLSSELFSVEQFGKAIFSMCRFLIKRKDYKRMESLIYRQKPDNKTNLLISAAYEANYGYDFYLAGKLLDAVFEEDPDCRPALELDAKCYYKSKAYGEAITAYGKLLKWYPNHVGLERRIAVCQVGNGEYDKALETLYRLDYLHPNDNETMRELARALFKKGSADKAVRYSEKILANPSNCWSQDYNDDAMYKWAAGDIAGAVQAFADYKAAYPREPYRLHWNEDTLLQKYNIGADDIQLMKEAATLLYRETKKLDNQEDK